MKFVSRRWLYVVLTASLLLAPLAGCTDNSTDSETPTEPSSLVETIENDNGLPFELSAVRWLHADVSGWAETGNLRNVTVSGGTITLNYDKAGVWPARNHAGANVNANPWIIVNVGGTWHGATFEWFRKGQMSKPVNTVAGDHIKQSPLNRFRPRSGEQYGFLVSGLARDKARNVRERTQVVMYTWP